MRRREQAGSYSKPIHRTLCSPHHRWDASIIRNFAVAIAPARLRCQSRRMAIVVFLRAVNVGGHQAFKPSKLAAQLTEFDVVNIGAAGTFVARSAPSESELRRAFLKRLPFEPEMMICSGENVLELVGSDASLKAPGDAGAKRFVTVLGGKLAKPPSLPKSFPEPGPWEIQVLSVAGPFVVVARRPGKKDLYPNAVIEKWLGVPATTRNWNTMEAIAKILRA